MQLKPKLFYQDIVYIFPALLLFATFTFYPFASGIYYSFTDWNGLSTTFVGWENYRNLIEDRSLIQAGKNTFIIAFVALIIGNSLALLLALALNRNLKIRGFLRTSFYLPAILSLVVVSMMWGNILQYDGVLNALLTFMGFGSAVKDWLGNLGTALNSIILINIWSGTGFAAVIYLAGLQNIPKDLYEAAVIDGATGWKKFWYVTIPLLMPVVTINLFLNLVGNLRIFDIPYVLTNGGPGEATSTISLVIYNFAFRNQTYGYATAAGILFMLVIALITFIQLRITRKREIEL